MPNRADAGASPSPVQLTLTAPVPGARFTPDRPPFAALTLRSTADQTYTYSRTETVSDYVGSVTSLLTDTVTLAPGVVLSEIVRPAIAGLGYFALSVSLTPLAIGGAPQPDAPPIIATLPLAIMRVQPDALDPPSPFGMSGTLTGSARGDPSASARAMAVTPSGLTGSGSAPLTDFALTYGHLSIDGSLATWGNAAEADLTDPRPDQVVGIPNWTPANLSARIYTMWDEHAFYLAADMRDEHFDAAPSGYNMYQGDSLQFGWTTDPLDYGHRYNLTVGLTVRGAANFQYNLLGPWTGVREAIRPDPATGDLIYTLAIPWSRLGGYLPRIGQEIAFDLIANQNEQHARIGWIQFSPGVGIGFHPRLYPLWTLIGGKPVEGLRLGGLYAPPQGTLSFPLPSPAGQVLIHDGGMRAIALRVNGTPVTVFAGNARGQIVQYATSAVDTSRYLRAGNKYDRGTQAGRGTGRGCGGERLRPVTYYH